MHVSSVGNLYSRRNYGSGAARAIFQGRSSRIRISHPAPIGINNKTEIVNGERILYFQSVPTRSLFSLVG